MIEDSTRVAAARARARRHVLPGERAALQPVEPRLWRVAPASDQWVFTVAEELQLNGADMTDLPIDRLSRGVAKTMLAALVVTWQGQGHPYPGRVASVDDVLFVLGSPALTVQAEAHIKGALNKLSPWGLVQLGDESGSPAPPADLGVPLRLGPAVALWSGPWLAELHTVIDHVAEERQLMW